VTGLTGLLCAWDLDGTLVDSAGDICLHANRALAEAGLPSVPGERVLPHVGHGAAELVRGVLGELGVPEEEFPRVLAIFQSHYAREPVVMSRLFPGAREAVLRLRDHGIPSVVVTNKPHPIATQVALKLGLEDVLAALEGGRPGVPLKPHRALLDRAVAAAGREPGPVVVVGDSTVDADLATTVGCPFLGVAHGLDQGRGLLARGVELLGSLAEVAERVAALRGRLDGEGAPTRAG
jgi:phosphoglycolate phosphatase